MKILWDRKIGTELNSKNICEYMVDENPRLYVGTASTNAWTNFISVFKNPYSRLQCTNSLKDKTFIGYNRVIYTK
jgi:hypothetical protein